MDGGWSLGVSKVDFATTWFWVLGFGFLGLLIDLKVERRKRIPFQPGPVSRTRPLRLLPINTYKYLSKPIKTYKSMYQSDLRFA